MLRRQVGGQADLRFSGSAIQGHRSAVAGGDPEPAIAWQKADVVHQEGRLEPPLEPGTGRIGHIDDRDVLGLVAEPDPESAAVRVDREVAGPLPELGPADDPSVREADRHDFCGAGVGDERVPAVRMRRGVARLAEALEDMSYRERGPVDYRHCPDVRVADDCGVAAGKLDAVRRDGHRDGLDRTAAQRVDGGDPRLRVAGYERQRRAPGLCQVGPQRERGGNGCA